MKGVVFGIMEGWTRRGRPSREWLDDIKEWCQMDIHSLSRMAQDRTQWKWRVRRALDTNGESPWNDGMMDGCMDGWMDGWM